MSNIETVKNDSTRSLRTEDRAEPVYVTPLADILENDNEYVVLADMPGASAEAVSIELESNELRIEGEHEALDGSKEIYRRVFRVGPGVDPEGITAEVKLGVLHLVAKKSDARRARQISVRAG